MQLIERRRCEGDLSADRVGLGSAAQLPPPSKTRRRALLALVLATALMIPVDVLAQESPPDESTTTTTMPTTTTQESTTSTSDSASTSTTVASGQTTTTSGTPETTPDDGTESDDSLDGEEGEEEPVLLPLPSILFPVVGKASYRDTYDAPRDGGTRLHKGTDISAEQGAPVIAVAAGVVERMGTADKAGLYVVIRHRNGWRSAYAHLNNDSPGTDNGLTMGFGPGIEVGARVQAGTVLGYVGDSGNSEENSHHLHFELHQPDGYRANPYPALRKARRLSEASVLATVDYDDVRSDNVDLVAHLDPGTGFNAQIATLDEKVYLGTWGNEERCPGTGIRVFDVSDPTQPVAMAGFADHTTLPDTAAASIWVGKVQTERFDGTVGVVGLARCGSHPTPDRDDFAGFAIYDLNDPANPVRLSFEPSGKTNRGIVGLDVSASNGQVLLAVAVSNPAEGPVPGEDGFEGAVDGVANGDTLWIFEITDPNQPRALAEWGPPVEVGATPADPADAIPGSGRKVTWLDHHTLAAGLESGNTVVLDVADPEQPVEAWSAGANSYELDSSPALLPGAVIDGRLLLIDERRAVEEGVLAGTHLIVDTFESPGTEMATFLPRSEDGEERPSGYYLPSGSHYHQANGSLVAWLSDGLRVISLEDPTKPRETAHFVPAPAFDPQRWWVAPDGETRFPMVWDVVSADGYVYASDHHSGLWVVEITLPAEPLTGNNVAN